MQILLDPAPAAAPAAGGAPAAPAAPAPAAPSPAPAAGGDGGEPNPFDALDGMIAKNRGKAPPDKKPDDAKGEPKDKADPKAPDKPTAAAAPDPGKKIEPGPKALREQLEKTNTELKTYREKATTLESKIAEYEARGKDTTALAERLATVEKERETLQAELRGLKQEASPEFKEKFEKPFNRAAEIAKNIVTQLQTVEIESADGSMAAPRAATWDDFARIFSMPYGQAQAEAEKLFGRAERVIMSHYERLHGLQEEKNAAMAEERENFKAKTAESEAKRAQTVEAIQTAWRKVNAELVEKNPELYAAKPDDPEEAKFVAEAHALFDSKPKTWQQQVVKDAHIRNKTAGYYLAQHRLSKANDRIAELEATVAELKGSRPGATRTPGGAEKTGDKSWSEDLRETLNS